MEMAASGKRPATLEIRAEPGSTVYVAGTFNAWDPLHDRMKDEADIGVYTVILQLPPGRYEYKFIVNGVWCIDPECTEWSRNDFGSLNSVLHVD
jgi:1,4-alpha-glucan branching enzyme